jgi:hypothetical protein
MSLSWVSHYYLSNRPPKSETWKLSGSSSSSSSSHPLISCYIQSVKNADSTFQMYMILEQVFWRHTDLGSNSTAITLLLFLKWQNQVLEKFKEKTKQNRIKEQRNHLALCHKTQWGSSDPKPRWFNHIKWSFRLLLIHWYWFCFLWTCCAFGGVRSGVAGDGALEPRASQY